MNKKNPEQIKEIQKYFFKMARARKPLPTHREYERQTHRMVDLHRYNNLKNRFILKYAKKKKPVTENKLESVTSRGREVRILLTIPGNHAPTFGAALMQALEAVCGDRKIKVGKLKCVTLANPDALELQEEING